MATDSTIPRIDGAPHFTADAWDHVIRAADRINSREAVVWMSPDVFLALAERGEDPEKTRQLAHVTVFNAMPYLAGDFDRETGVMRMTSHEGRHRARRLKTLGVTQFPVRLEARRVRWADTMDRPTTYIGEEGNVIPGSAVHFLAPTKVEPARCVAHGAARCGCSAAARCPAGTYSEYRGHKILHSDGKFYVMPYKAENASEAAARRWIDAHVEHTITWMGKHKIAPTESDVTAITAVAACHASNRDEGLLDYLRAARGRSAPLGGDISLAWQMMTRDVYSDGDLVAVVVRECLQNSGDAIRRAYRKRAGQWQIAKDTGYIKIDIQVTGSRTVMARGNERTVQTGTISIEDNGIGMDLFTGSDATFKTGVFFNLGGSDKKDLDDDGNRVAAGGFGAAKAAILGSSLSGSWAVWSRNHVARKLPGQDPDFDMLPNARQGTRLEIYDVDLSDRWSTFISSSGTAVERARIIIAGSETPDFQVRLNGSRVESWFQNRGTRARRFEELDWGDDRTKVEIRTYKRPDGNSGSYWIRLKGMLQFRDSADRGGLPYDVVIDMDTQVDPQEATYPFPISRSVFKSGAGTAFRAMREIISVDTASALKQSEWAVLGADASDPREIKASQRIAAVFADAVGDMHETLVEVAKMTQAFYENDSRVDDALVGAWGGHVTSAAAPLETPEDANALLEAVAKQADVYIYRAEESAILDVIRGSANDDDVVTVTQLLERISEATPEDQRAVTSATMSMIVEKLSGRLTPERARVFRKKASEVNPFGKHATVFRSNANYNDDDYKKFLKEAKRHTKTLAVWDFACRLTAREGRMRLNFGTGFVLEQGTRGLNAPVPGNERKRVVLINPDYVDAVLTTHLPSKNALAIAIYFRDIACHEVAHLTDAEHDESWAISRENLAVNTMHTLPAIEDVVRRVFKLGKRRSFNSPKSQPDMAEKLLRQDIEAYKQRISAYETETTELREERNALQKRANHAAMDRDTARKALDAAKGTMSRLLPRLSAVTAYGEYREWLRGAGSAILGGLSVDEFLASLDGDPKLVADFLLGEGAQKIADAFTDPDKVARGAEARMVVASEWGDVVPLDPAYDPYARSRAGFGRAKTYAEIMAELAAKNASVGFTSEEKSAITQIASGLRFWVDGSEEDSLELTFATRESGNMMNDTPGDADIKAGHQLITRVTAAFPGVVGDLGTCDEWVNVRFRRPV